MDNSQPCRGRASDFKKKSVANVSNGSISLYSATQDVSFVAAPSTVALSHSKPASAMTARDNFGAQDSNKRRVLGKAQREVSIAGGTLF